MQHKNINIYLLGILLLVSGVVNAQMGKNHTWFGNSHFQINEKNEVTNIKVNKKPWEAFTLYTNELDLSQNPLLSFDIRTDQVIELRIDMVDMSNENKIQTPISKTIIPLNNFISVTYDFSDLLARIDATKVTHFQFFVQPSLDFEGNIEIKNVTIGKPSESIISNQSEFYILSNTKTNEITIQSNKIEFDQIKIYNALGILTNHQNFTPTFLEKLNIQTYSSGVYFLEVIAKNKSLQAGTFVR